MTRLPLWGVVLCLASLLSVSSLPAQNFIRGDANGDGTLNIADPIFGLSYVYAGGAAPAVLDSADTNDNGFVEIADAVYTLRALFAGSALPPAPFPMPGPDTTPPNFPAGPSGDLELRLADTVGCGGSQALMSVHITNLVVMEALNIRVEYDPAEVFISDASTLPLDAILGSSPDFFQLNFGADSLTIGTVFSLISPTGNGLQPQADARIIDLILNVDPSVPMGSTITLDLADDPTAPILNRNLGSFEGEVILALVQSGTVTMTCVGIEYLRGDHNEDSTVSISDAVHLIEFLFLGGPGSGCDRTGDVNSDGLVDVADVISLLNGLFNGATIPGPFPICGIDPLVNPVGCTAYSGNCP